MRIVAVNSYSNWDSQAVCIDLNELLQYCQLDIQIAVNNLCRSIDGRNNKMAHQLVINDEIYKTMKAWAEGFSYEQAYHFLIGMYIGTDTYFPQIVLEAKDYCWKVYAENETATILRDFKFGVELAYIEKYYDMVYANLADKLSPEQCERISTKDAEVVCAYVSLDPQSLVFSKMIGIAVIHGKFDTIIRFGFCVGHKKAEAANWICSIDKVCKSEISYGVDDKKFPLYEAEPLNIDPKIFWRKSNVPFTGTALQIRELAKKIRAFSIENDYMKIASNNLKKSFIH